MDIKWGLLFKICNTSCCCSGEEGDCNASSSCNSGGLDIPAACVESTYDAVENIKKKYGNYIFKK